MESNFDFLKEIVLDKEYNENSSKEWIRYKRDAIFLIKEIEEHLLLREMLYASLKIRMLTEIISFFWISEIRRQNKNSIMISWINKIYSSENARRTKRKKRNISENISIKFIIENYPNKNEELFDNFTIIQSSEILGKMNNWMHYTIDEKYSNENGVKNKDDTSTFINHRDKIRYNHPEMKEISEIINLIFDIFVYIFKINNPNKKFPIFDENFYKKTGKVMNRFLENNYIYQYIEENKICPLCEEGTFFKPKKDKMEYGAKIICNKCKAFIDKTMKIKQDTGLPHLGCKENIKYINDKGDIQNRYNLRTGEKYKACNKCEWDDRGKNKKEIETKNNLNMKKKNEVYKKLRK